MSADDVYVIAVKRERRAEVSPDWIDVVRGTSGVTIVGDANASRVQVRASAEAIQAIADRLGGDVHVEKVIPHHLS